MHSPSRDSLDNSYENSDSAESEDTEFADSPPAVQSSQHALIKPLELESLESLLKQDEANGATDPFYSASSAHTSQPLSASAAARSRDAKKLRRSSLFDPPPLHSARDESQNLPPLPVTSSHFATNYSSVLSSRAILEALPVIVISFDHHNNVTYSNQEFHSYTGYSASAAASASADEIFETPETENFSVRRERLKNRASLASNTAKESFNYNYTAPVSRSIYTDISSLMQSILHPDDYPKWHYRSFAAMKHQTDIKIEIRVKHKLQEDEMKSMMGELSDNNNEWIYHLFHGKPAYREAAKAQTNEFDFVDSASAAAGAASSVCVKTFVGYVCTLSESTSSANSNYRMKETEIFDIQRQIHETNQRKKESESEKSSQLAAVKSVKELLFPLIQDWRRQKLMSKHNLNSTPRRASEQSTSGELFGSGSNRIPADRSADKSAAGGTFRGLKQLDSHPSMGIIYVDSSLTILYANRILSQMFNLSIYRIYNSTLDGIVRQHLSAHKNSEFTQYLQTVFVSANSLPTLAATFYVKGNGKILRMIIQQDREYNDWQNNEEAKLMENSENDSSGSGIGSEFSGSAATKNSKSPNARAALSNLTKGIIACFFEASFIEEDEKNIRTIPTLIQQTQSQQAAIEEETRKLLSKTIEAVKPPTIQNQLKSISLPADQLGVDSSSSSLVAEFSVGNYMIGPDGNLQEIREGMKNPFASDGNAKQSNKSIANTNSTIINHPAIEISIPKPGDFSRSNSAAAVQTPAAASSSSHHGRSGSISGALPKLNLAALNGVLSSPSTASGSNHYSNAFASAVSAPQLTRNNSLAAGNPSATPISSVSHHSASVMLSPRQSPRSSVVAPSVSASVTVSGSLNPLAASPPAHSPRAVQQFHFLHSIVQLFRELFQQFESPPSLSQLSAYLREIISKSRSILNSAVAMIARRHAADETNETGKSKHRYLIETIDSDIGNQLFASLSVGSDVTNAKFIAECEEKATSITGIHNNHAFAAVPIIVRGQVSAVLGYFRSAANSSISPRTGLHSQNYSDSELVLLDILSHLIRQFIESALISRSRDEFQTQLSYFLHLSSEPLMIVNQLQFPIFISSSLADLLRWPFDDLLKQNIYHFIAPEDWKKTNAALVEIRKMNYNKFNATAAAAADSKAATKNSTRSVQFINRYVNSTGDYHTIQWRGTVMKMLDARELFSRRMLKSAGIEMARPIKAATATGEGVWFGEEEVFVLIGKDLSKIRHLQLELKSQKEKEVQNLVQGMGMKIIAPSINEISNSPAPAPLPSPTPQGPAARNRSRLPGFFRRAFFRAAEDLRKLESE